MCGLRGGTAIKLSSEERQLLTTLANCEKSNRTSTFDLYHGLQLCESNQSLADSMIDRGLIRVINVNWLATTEAGIESLAEAEVDEKFAAIDRRTSVGDNAAAFCLLMQIVREQAVRIAELELRA